MEQFQGAWRSVTNGLGVKESVFESSCVSAVIQGVHHSSGDSRAGRTIRVFLPNQQRTVVSEPDYTRLHRGHVHTTSFRSDNRIHSDFN